MKWAWVCHDRCEVLPMQEDESIGEDKTEPGRWYFTHATLAWLLMFGSWRSERVTLVDLDLDRWWSTDIAGRLPPDLITAREYAMRSLAKKGASENDDWRARGF